MTELQFLLNFSNFLQKDLSVSELSEGLKSLLNTLKQIEMVKIYVYDSLTGTIRDCDDNWNIIENENPVNTYYKEIEGQDFLINYRGYKLPQNIGDINLKINSAAMPLMKAENLFGMILLNFAEETYVDVKFLSLIKLISMEVSLKLQNIVLNEQSKINVDFHDSMKNIAKIIETQYELNYIVPLIGEMLDRFISDHLIYVFLKNQDGFYLVWPKACNDERVYTVLKELTPDTEYILTNNDKIGAFPLVSEGEIIGCIVARSTLDKLSKRDISYLEQLTRQSATTINRANSYSKILQYATIDALTNLNNRRQFELRLGQEIATTKRQNNPLCAMMIDIDFFKSVNDKYGHASGDAVLRGVANIIKSALRESDIPSRYGGEEFAVLLPYTHIDEAKIVGERLRKSIEETPIEINVEDVDVKFINVTISMGLAEFNSTESGEELFERADKALYEAKEGGRNRVCLA